MENANFAETKVREPSKTPNNKHEGTTQKLENQSMSEQHKTDFHNEGLLAKSTKTTSSAKIQTLKQRTNPLLSGQINFNEFTPKVGGKEFRADDAYGLEGN